MIEDEPLDEAPEVAEPDFSRAAQRLVARKTDRYGNSIADKPMMSDKERRALEKSIEANKDEAQAEVTRLLKMKKTAEIEAMGYSPTDPKKHIDVTIILKRFNLGKPEFVLKNGGKEVIPQPHYNGGVTWVYADANHKKVVVDALHTISLKEFNMNTENTDRNTDGLQRSKEKISALKGMVQKKKKRPMDDLLKSKEKELSWYSPKKSVKEEPEQVDELSKKTKDAYVAKRGAQLSSMMYGSDKNYNSLTGKKQANAVKGIKKAMGMKEEPEQVDELQTRERDRQMANTGQLGSSLDSKEKAAKEVYGKDGKVEHPSLAHMRKMLNKSNKKTEQREDGIDLTAFMEKANSAIKEAVGDASSPEAFVRKFNKMTDVNDHNGAAILLATFLKDTKAMKCLKLVKEIHELEGSLPSGIWAYRANWSTQLWQVFSKKYPQVKQ